MPAPGLVAHPKPAAPANGAPATAPPAAHAAPAAAPPRPAYVPPAPPAKRPSPAPALKKRTPPPAAPPPAKKAAPADAPPARRVLSDSSSDEEEGFKKPTPQPKPVAAPKPKPTPKPAAAPKPAPPPAPPAADATSDDDVPLSARAAAAAPSPARAPAAAASSDSDDDLPLGARAAALAPPPAKKAKKKTAPKPAPPAAKKKKKAAAPRSSASPAPAKKRVRASPGPSKSKDKKWTTLAHGGVLFPPDYEPHGVRMLYEGRPVDLTPDQEEVATLFAAMLDTDFAAKPKFRANFWAAFSGVLGAGHAVRDLAKCDFRPIAEHLGRLREEKKAASKEEKAAAKAERDAAEARFKSAVVDGRVEAVGNFRVEPPGLFRGRGEHPRMGQLKRRIYPRDITINIGRGEAAPPHPYPGQRWKEVRHDGTVTWLAFWKDPINEKEYKYVWLAANSAFKADSDKSKYETARALKARIASIRASYERDWASADVDTQQMGVALYFIDKLALRAGHEKDTENEADTVGCCNLKVSDVDVLPGHKVKFDFLGKDSIRYENVVDVEPRVAALVAAFRVRDGKGKAKGPSDLLFYEGMVGDLNGKLKSLMPKLSAKVFRTFNASVTLDSLLAAARVPPGATVDEKKAAYDRANKEVAVLCNHQRAVPKGHAGQMEKVSARIEALEAEEAALAVAAKKASRDGDGGAEAKRLARKREQLAKARLQAAVREDLKTVALGTSKINYLDPRITIAWCKRTETPLEKVFNKSLLTQFRWAMDEEPEFRF